MGHHHEDTSHLSAEEILFRDYMRRGNDFFAIEIFRYARVWYQKALDLHVDDSLASQKIAECKEKLRFESRTILKVLIAAAIIVAGAWLLIHYAF